MSGAPSSQPTQLAISHLPSCLSDGDTASLLRHFGAVAVETDLRRGAACASFADAASAQQALSMLHQLQLFGRRLRAVYATLPPLSTPTPPQQPATAPLHFATPPVLRSLRRTPLPYAYPPASPSVVRRIADCLLNVPEFYVQTLHLMNNMNLPCPLRRKAVSPERDKEASQVQATSAVSGDTGAAAEGGAVAASASAPAECSSAPKRARLEIKLLAPAKLAPSPASLSAERQQRIAELRRDVLAPEQRHQHKVFANYAPGVAANRLYVKNIDKTVTEQQLCDVFGLFVDNDQSGAFSVRYFKVGRLKAQAFVSYESVAEATRAVDTVNGLVLSAKPIVVQFAQWKAAPDDASGECGSTKE